MKEYVSDITVHWSHCDAAGIVFYPNFYIWFDQGTERLFSANRLSYAELDQDFGVSGMPLVENGTSYKNACKLGATLKCQNAQSSKLFRAARCIKLSSHLTWSFRRGQNLLTSK